ncbi:MAG: hypothetical protein ACP5UV_06120, partial [Thermoplasmata archaeon]
ADKLIKERIGAFPPIYNVSKEQEGYFIDITITAVIKLIFFDEEFGYQSYGGKRNTILYCKCNELDLASSDDKTKLEKFKEIVLELKNRFRDKARAMEEEQKRIKTDLDDVKRDLWGIIDDLALGIRISGKCAECRKIKDIGRLEDLMPYA